MTTEAYAPKANTEYMRAGLLRLRFVESFITYPMQRKEIADLFAPLSALERANLIIDAMNEAEIEKPPTHPCLQSAGAYLAAELKATFPRLRGWVYYRCHLEQAPEVVNGMVMEAPPPTKTEMAIVSFLGFVEKVVELKDPITMDELVGRRGVAKKLFWGD